MRYIIKQVLHHLGYSIIRVNSHKNVLNRLGLGYKVIKSNSQQHAVCNCFVLTEVPPPPNIIPEKHEAAFTLSGKIPVLYSYRNDTITNADAILSIFLA